jgi:oligoendopeptidase F
MERKDVSQNLKWKLTDIFATEEAWEQEYKSVEAEYGSYDYSAFDGKLADKETLLACFRLNDAVSRRLEKLYVYAMMSHHEDVRISKNNSRLATCR